jgi:hypothetical protein
MRNIRCPHYSGCLDAAIDMDLSGWQCEGCRHVRQEGTIDPAEIEACILLLWCLFLPDLYEAAKKTLKNGQLIDYSSNV